MSLDLEMIAQSIEIHSDVLNFLLDENEHLKKVIYEKVMHLTNKIALLEAKINVFYQNSGQKNDDINTSTTI